MLTELASGFVPLSDRPQRLNDIWDRWRGARAMPSRRDVMPEDLRDLLPSVALMVTAADPADCRYILSGTVVDTMAPRPLKGCTIRESVAMGDLTALPTITAHYANVIATRQPSLSRGSMAYHDRGYIAFDRMLLPLSDTDGTVDHILCGFFYNMI
jgi:hypothetical protein